MRQGITTRFLGPTNTKGSRYKATARPGKGFSLTDHADHAKNFIDNHARVAQLLATKLGWDGLWVGGGAPDERGYQYVNLGEFEGSIVPAGTEGVDWFRVHKQVNGQ